jgi:hypothetical protein
MTEKPEHTPLLPCPFCGGEATFNALPSSILGQVHCTGEECFGPRTTALTKQDSIVQWNTRSVNAVPDLVAALDQIKGVCEDNAPESCDKTMALDFVRQVTSAALAKVKP